MSIYVIKLFDIKGGEQVEWLDQKWLPIIKRYEDELMNMSKYAIDSEFLPVYLYISQPRPNVLFLSSTTGAWKWYLAVETEDEEKKKKLMDIGYEQFIGNLMTKWLGYAQYYKEEIKGTLAALLLRLISDYELLRIISY